MYALRLEDAVLHRTDASPTTPKVAGNWQMGGDEPTAAQTCKGSEQLCWLSQPPGSLLDGLTLSCSLPAMIHK